MVRRSTAASRGIGNPTLAHEGAFWHAGHRIVAGVDEVGRGSLAGPLVAAAVVLPAGLATGGTTALRPFSDVRDSKQLSPKAREKAAARIVEFASYCALGVVSAEELDDLGLTAANRMAMERAVLALPVPPEALLLDACVVDLGCPQVGIINGDAHCLSVAAASIIAKVARDRMMVEQDAADPRYGFARHKGYGTASHLAAIRAFGLSPLHRRSFGCLALVEKSASNDAD